MAASAASVQELRSQSSSNDTSLVVEIQKLGNHDVARVTRVFGHKTIEVSIELAGGFRAKVQGRAEELALHTDCYGVLGGLAVQ